jgi:hypothetical protein
MKKLTLMAASLLAALSVYGQGSVDFNNFGNALPPDGGVIHGIRGDGVALADGIVAQLYWSSSMSGQFMATGTPTPVGDAFGAEFPGFFGAGVLTIPGVTPPGGVAFFEVRAWEVAYGASFEAAASAPAMGGRQAFIGTSGVFMADTGNPQDVPPGLPTDLGALIPSFRVNPVPEPSVIALGLIGAGALLMLRRRK